METLENQIINKYNKLEMPRAYSFTSCVTSNDLLWLCFPVHKQFSSWPLFFPFNRQSRALSTQIDSLFQVPWLLQEVWLETSISYSLVLCSTILLSPFQSICKHQLTKRPQARYVKTSTRLQYNQGKHLGYQICERYHKADVNSIELGFEKDQPCHLACCLGQVT